MEKLTWIIMAFVAGAFLPLQAGMNNKLAKAGGSAIHASAISFAVGMLGLAVYILISSQHISWRTLKDAPPYAWVGGLVGAFYVTVIVLAFPKIGPGLTFGLVVAGQLLLSALMEHSELLEAQSHVLSVGRVLGFLLIMAGVIIMKKL